MGIYGYEWTSGPYNPHKMFSNLKYKYRTVPDPQYTTFQCICVASNSTHKLEFLFILNIYIVTYSFCCAMAFFALCGWASTQSKDGHISNKSIHLLAGCRIVHYTPYFHFTLFWLFYGETNKWKEQKKNNGS